MGVAGAELPQVFSFEDGSEEDAGRELARLLAGADMNEPFMVSSVHGRGLASAVGAAGVTPPAGADQAWADEIGAEVRRAGAGLVVAIGGGRCLDVAKLVAARSGLAMVSVPTQLSHDGICSPVAVVPGADGKAESLGALAPDWVYLSLPTLMAAPIGSLSAGLGDLIANPFALRDWDLAVQRGLEEHDQVAWDLSVESYGLIDETEDIDAASKDPETVRRIADALVLSGLAMVAAGSSRPASGGEHEISHAVDNLWGGRALHGAQVAFGTVVSAHLYGEDVGALRARLRSLGLPDSPSAMGLSLEETIEAVAHAPQTRPGRYTILEHTALDHAGIGKLVREIWDE